MTHFICQNGYDIGHMGYGGAPPWVYKNEIILRDLSHSQETSRLNSEIQSLKKENQELKKHIEELEAEINDLRWYKFEHPEKIGT